MNVNCRCLGHVASCHKSSLTCEIFHFDAENHVALHKLVTYRSLHPIWKVPKYHFDILHFFCYWICLKGILPYLASMARACTTVLRTKLMFSLQAHCLLLKNMFTHQLWAGLWSIPCVTEKLAVCSGCDSCQVAFSMTWNHISTNSNFSNLLLTFGLLFCIIIWSLGL